MQSLEPFILDLLVRSGDLLLKKQQTALASHKSEHDLVTDADLASQEHIVNAIKAKFPTHSIYAEEGMRTSSLFAPDCWVIDPLDGTNNYSYGFPIWGVSIAYAKEGKIIAGGVAYPSQGIYLLAEAGKGARKYEIANMKSPTKMSVSKRADIKKSMVLVCAHLASKEGEENLESLGRVAKNVFNVRNLGSAVFNIGFVAAGLADACVEFKLQPYDGAAGALLVGEAGGTVTDLYGEPYRIDSQNLVCSNSHVHEKIIEILGSK